MPIRARSWTNFSIQRPTPYKQTATQDGTMASILFTAACRPGSQPQIAAGVARAWPNPTKPFMERASVEDLTNFLESKVMSVYNLRHEMQAHIRRSGSRPPHFASDASAGHQGGARGPDGQQRCCGFRRERAQRFSLAGVVRRGWAKRLAGQTHLRSPSKLSPEQMAWIARTVHENTPQQLRFEFGLWTLTLIRHLIH